MDFPLVLSDTSSLAFVYGYDELKQDLYLLLKTNFGSFLQTYALGSNVSVHTADPDILEVGITRVVGQIPGLSCERVEIYGESIRVRVVYRGQLSNFDFSLSSF